MSRDPLFGREPAGRPEITPPVPAPPRDADPIPINDYQIDRDSERGGPPIANQLLRLLVGVLLIVLAAISFGLFWVVAMMLHLF